MHKPGYPSQNVVESGSGIESMSKGTNTKAIKVKEENKFTEKTIHHC